MIVDELVAVLGFDLRGEADLKRFNDGLKNAEGNARGFASAVARIGAGVAAAYAAIGGANAIGRGISNFITGITSTGREFENFGVRLRALEGSSEAAEKAMGWIKQFAIETPLELDEVVNAFANMRSFGLDPTNGSLRAIVDTMAATGGGADKLNGIVLALGQAWTKGKLQGEEAMQLLERGVPVWELLSEATGQTAAQLQELSSKGKLGRETIQLLIDALGKKYLGASEEAAKTFDGILSNLSDNWKNFLLTISDAGYYDDVKRRLQSLLEWVNGLWANGFAQRLARNISRALVGSMNTASQLATQAYRIGRGFYQAADGVVALTAKMLGLSKGMTAAGLGVGLLASSAVGRGALIAMARRVPMIAALLAFEDVLAALNGDDSLIGSTDQGQKAIANLQAKFKELEQSASRFADAIARARESLSSGWSEGSGDFGWLKGLSDSWQNLKKEWDQPITIAGFEQGSISDAMTAMEGWAKNAGENFTRLFTDPVGLALKIIAESIDRITAAIQRTIEVMNSIRGVVGGASFEANDTGSGSPSSAPGRTRRNALEFRNSLVPQMLGFKRTPDDRVRGAFSTAEGMQLDPDPMIQGLERIKANLDSGILDPARAAREALSDLERNIEAKADLNITPFLQKVEQAKQAARSLENINIGKGGRVGPVVTPAREMVAD
ncbi:tape measure protein [Aureimonas fodinaquatilis]|uniref:Tape measure protein n=1 Tax=Aureimonas fodinaquatilis TaxID=2565783 RepID=A0A5B0DVF8_9HYPH|nr:tape measure protein [Aureimonas fodinaquatilis]KAA0970807.1 tape measure protein [Aureimonas fodinaquatilis]